MEFEAKEFIKKLYPNAKCVKKICDSGFLDPVWHVELKDNTIIGSSYSSEENAFIDAAKLVKSIINNISIE